MTKLNGQKPIAGYKATAEDLIALHANTGRHPKALGYELTRTTYDTIVRLAYGEFAEKPLAGVPDALASMAYDEMERRDSAVSSLLSSCPGLAAALSARA